MSQLILTNTGITLSTNKILRLVLKFRQRCPYGGGWMFIEFLCAHVHLNAEQRAKAMNDPAVVNLLMYLDPTGEQAVRNILRGKGK